MPRWEFRLPDVGEGVAEGEIVAWLVKPGEVVADDQAIVEVMTDKATVTITAPKAGVVLETRGKVGEIIPVHSVLVVFDLDHAPTPAPSAPSTNGTKAQGHTAPSADGPAATAVGDLRETLPGMAGAGRPAARPATKDVGYFNEKPLATPATRKLARDVDVDLRLVPPSGPDGRVTRADVEAFRSAPVPLAAPAPESGPALPRREAEAVRSGERADERIPFAGIRRKIAQKMSRSKTTAAHFTFVEECDVTGLKALRQRLLEPADELGVKLSFLPFVVKAVVAALKKHPILNTTLDETTSELVFRKHFHIGIATATDAGLLVPVVKDADTKSLVAIAKDIDRLSREARAGKARVEDLQGSTFTITSLGAKGGLFATPIINFPEVAILGVHQMKTKPVVRDGEIVVGDVMLLSLSFDHRIVDGHVGAAFALDVIAYLEKPETLFLEMA
jgi:pyruvate dehydrogenase E2 component (dihydrolipoamide acetyltransferase)